MILRTLVRLALGLLLSALATQTCDSQNGGGGVVAEVNGYKVTLAELEQKQSPKLLDVRYQYYRAQREALDQFIDDYLLEMRARQEHLSVEELLKRDLDSQIKDPSEEQLKLLYEAVQTDQPFPAVRDKIVDSIRQSRRNKARATYVKMLRSTASVRIMLAPPGAEVALDDAPTRGPRDALVRLIEFADYECPYCQKIQPELKNLQQEFGNKLMFAFKDFPLPMHPRAQKAAEAARCAAVQGKFWDFQDALFSNNKRLDIAQLKQHARALKLDAERFDQCLDSGQQAAAVQKDLAQAQRLGLTGTPSFFINGHFISGAVDYNTLREVVQQQLVEATKEQSAQK